ncbi:13269_t:CDS:1, partial [Cetraspora pellucida]
MLQVPKSAKSLNYIYYIPIKSESLIFGNTIDLDSPNFVMQSLALDSVVSSEVVKDNIKKNYSNIEFNVNTL